MTEPSAQPHATTFAIRPRMNSAAFMNFGDARVAERIWNMLSPCPMSGCWLWMGSLTTGYGRTKIGSRTDGSRRAVLLHRLMYEAAVGSIPEGLHIDHLCRTRPCCNPLHLEPVTNRENVMRSPIALPALHAAKTHCVRGHAFDEDNTLWYRGWRFCRACQLLRPAYVAKWGAKKAA